MSRAFHGSYRRSLFYLFVALCVLSCSQVSTYVVASGQAGSSLTMRYQAAAPKANVLQHLSNKRKKWCTQLRDMRRCILRMSNDKSDIDPVKGDSVTPESVATTASTATNAAVEAPCAAETCPRPSSLMSINVLMLLFYGTLGSIMPYLPIFYRRIGATGK